MFFEQIHHNQPFGSTFWGMVRSLLLMCDQSPAWLFGGGVGTDTVVGQDGANVEVLAVGIRHRPPFSALKTSVSIVSLESSQVPV